MRKKISFFILSNNSSPVKRLPGSRAMLRSLGVLFAACLILITYVVYDYTNLKKTVSDHQELQNIISHQSGEIAGQRNQVQKFADEITALKSKLIALNDFEKKIRIIANIEKSADQDSLFGVGGSIPDEFNSQVSPELKNDSTHTEFADRVDTLGIAPISAQKDVGTLLVQLNGNGQNNFLSAMPAIWPVEGIVVSGFGQKFSSGAGLRNELARGVAIAVDKAAPVMATADGAVTYVGARGVFGNMVVVDHGYGVITRYGYLSKMLKKNGDTVRRGDIIAMVGNKDRSSSMSHLYYETMLNGVRVDPYEYILN